MNTNEWIYTHIWSFQRAFEKLFVSISIILLSFLQCLLSIFLPLFACWCVIDSLSVSWDKSKYGKEISRKCKPHYFLEQDHTYLVFFLLFFFYPLISCFVMYVYEALLKSRMRKWMRPKRVGKSKVTIGIAKRLIIHTWYCSVVCNANLRLNGITLSNFFFHVKPTWKSWC